MLNRSYKHLVHLPHLIFFLLLLMAAVLSGIISHYIREQQQTRFEREVTAHTAALQGRIEDFDKLLRATRAFWVASPTDVTPERFDDFTRNLELEKRYPDVQALGFSAVIPQGSEAALETLMDAYSVTPFSIQKPLTDQKMRASVIFVSPSTEKNNKVLGFDLMSESIRREALLKSVQTDEFQVTQPLKLLQTTHKEDGFLMFVPVWRESDNQSRNIEDAIGIIYIAVRSDDFIHQLSAAYDNEEISQTIYINAKKLNTATDKSKGSFFIENQLSLGGQRWDIHYIAPQYFGSDVFRLVPFLTFFLGAFLATIAYLMMRSQIIARSYAEQMNDQLRQEQVKKEKARAEFEAIFHSIQDAAAFSDEKGLILRVNRALNQQFGYAAHELEGKELATLHLDHQTEAARWLTTPYRRRNGDIFQGETQRTPVIHANGEPLGVLELIRDVTEKLEADRALREAERRSRAILDTMPHIVWMSDEQGTVTYTNEQLRRQLGSLSVREAVYTEDLESYDRMWTQAHERQYCASCEVRLRMDSEPRWFEMNVSPVHGEQTEWVASAIDIHDRLLAERLAQDNETRYKGMLEGLPQIVWLSDRKGQNIYFNRQWHKYVGEERAQQEFVSLIHPDDRVSYDERWQQALLYEQPFEAEHRLLGHNGMYHHHVTRALPVLDENGKVIEWIGTSTNVDDSIYAEETARLLAHISSELGRREYYPLTVRTLKYMRVIEWLQKRGMLAALWGASGELIVVAEQTGWKQLCYETLQPWVEHVLHGKENLEIIHDCLHEIALTQLQLLPLLGLDGTLLGVLGIASRSQWQNRDYELMQEIAKRLAESMDNDALRMQAQQAQNELIVLNTSLEERVKTRTAELEEANRELEAFSYSVSHDLRTPLRHISGFSDFLAREQEHKMDERSKRFLTNIKDGAQRMNTLIESLLEFSRMGRAPLRMAPLDLDALVKRVWEQLETERAGRAIQFQIESLPAVLGDSTLLELAFQNLLLNAIKYTRHQPKAVIRVYATYSETEICVSIADNGAGFDPTYAAKLFGVFQRLHRSEEFEGTGIGLANVRRIILRHGGRVEAQGAVDQGAMFSLFFPRVQHV